MLLWPSATGTPTRSAGVVLAVIAVIAGTVYFGRTIREPLTATQLRGIIPSFTPALTRETVFPEPVAVDWTGTIDGILAGGRGYSIRRTGTGEPFQAYIVEGIPSSVSEGPVRVVGLQTGISCAYAETLFGGLCTPTVDITTIEPLPILMVQ